MHGGFDGTYDNETWEWDGSAWALVSTLGPGARGRHSMVYDSARGVCVLFGGWPVDADFDGAKNEASPDTWEWDGATWSKVATAGPAGRTDAAMCFDRKLGVTVLFGGFVGPAFSNELWTWDGTTWVHAADLLDSQVPSHRHRAAMAYDTARSRCVLFGGTGASQEHDTWEFDGEVWVKASDGGARPGR